MVFSRYLETGTGFLNNFVTKRVWNHKIVYKVSSLFFKFRIQDGSLLSKKLKTFLFKQNDFQTIWIVLNDINKKRLTLLKSRKRYNLLNLYLKNDQFLLHSRKEYMCYILRTFMDGFGSPTFWSSMFLFSILKQTSMWIYKCIHVHFIVLIWFFMYTYSFVNFWLSNCFTKLSLRPNYVLLCNRAKL